MEQKGKDENKSVNEQMKKPLSRVPNNPCGFSTFEQLIKRFMEIQARKEESNRRLLQKTKENHAKSELSWLMDPTQTSRLLVYRKRRDQQTRARGKKLEEEYAETRRVENERQKREEREMMQAQYGSLRKHQNRYNSIMNEVEPEYMTPTVNFEKRTNRLAYELLEPDSQ